MARVKTLGDMARPRTFAKGAPRASDVCMRSLGIHPRNAKDRRDTLEAARDFGVTHIVWIYTTDKGFIAKCNGMGIRVSVALNTILTDGPGLRTRKRGRIEDVDGKLVCAPWMKSWNGIWGCANSPEYADIFLAYAKRCVDAGADTLQVDDPAMNGHAVKWGACFCEHCVSGFREWLKRNVKPAELEKLGIADADAFDYRAYVKGGGKSRKLHGLFERFQREATRGFFSAFRKKIDEHAGRRVVLSSNNFAGRWSTPYDLFDFGIAEMPARDAHPVTIRQRILDATRRGKTQLFTMPKPHGRAFQPSDVALTRKAVATAYACGGHVLVPWDIYMGGQPRYFGTPAQYAGLFAFVRENSKLFDGYEDAFAVGKGIKDPRFRAQPPVTILGGPEVYAFARAVPGKPKAPVVVHLVEWGKEAKPFKVALAPARFFGTDDVRVTLLLPGGKKQPLDSLADDRILVQIPALEPWAILLVEPETEMIRGTREGGRPPASPMRAAGAHAASARLLRILRHSRNSSTSTASGTRTTAPAAPITFHAGKP